mmetsp:Transcript_7143/g.21800  ORF Transcript_7143/g.21800 Transcript_7143/m.21800 type:complete len:231 (+) Transcript_7143:339-1031(+)
MAEGRRPELSERRLPLRDGDDGDEGATSLTRDSPELAERRLPLRDWDDGDDGSTWPTDSALSLSSTDVDETVGRLTELVDEVRGEGAAGPTGSCSSGWVPPIIGSQPIHQEMPEAWVAGDGCFSVSSAGFSSRLGSSSSGATDGLTTCAVCLSSSMGCLDTISTPAASSSMTCSSEATTAEASVAPLAGAGSSALAVHANVGVAGRPAGPGTDGASSMLIAGAELAADLA